MRACSKSDFGALAAGGVTVVLVIFFWFPIGRESVSLMPPVSLQGKTWTLNEPTTQQRAPLAAPRPAPTRKPPPTEARRDRKTKRANQPVSSHPIAASQPTHKVKIETKESSRASVASDDKANSPTAVDAVVPPGTLDPVQEYTMQDLIDGFESDPSRYPLDRSVRSDGISLTLEGLQRREKLFVLKVAVANGMGDDFFVKDFTVRAGATVLGSRSLFRILVESRRVREGYVVFQKPPSGAAVQIKLKEDGGKGRVIATDVPYRF